MKPLALGIALASLSSAAWSQDTGSATRGARFYNQACAACHSLQTDRNMTGPSLAGMWGRKAGTLESFRRYSPALKSSDVTWNEKSLDPWLADPAHFIPGNRMTFPGLKDAQPRADLIAYLKQATTTAQAQQPPQGGQMGGMMMGGQAAPNLKNLTDDERVRSVGYCGDTYKVTTADGKVHEFWERNLRLKTDSGDDGPQKGAPALVAAGMMGDRADVIFAGPDEIGGVVNPECW
jgi:cytochrome c